MVTDRGTWLIGGGIVASLVGFFVAPWGSFVTSWTAFSQVGEEPLLWLIPAASVACALFAAVKLDRLVLLAGVAGVAATVLGLYLLWSRPMFYASAAWGIALTVVGFVAVAVSASAAFLSPVGHSANILVMGPGGYRFSDYTKVGIPLTLVVLLVVLFVVPIFWPF